MKKSVESPAEILKSFRNPEATLPSMTYAEIMAKIEKLEKEAAIAMAVETFLDCDYKKVKISKRIAKVPKWARSVTKGRGGSCLGDSFTMGGVKSRARAGV